MYKRDRTRDDSFDGRLSKCHEVFSGQFDDYKRTQAESLRDCLSGGKER